MNKIYVAISFIAGAGLGVFGTWKYIRKNYITLEEMESVKKVYKEQYSDNNNEETVTDEQKKEDLKKVEDIVNEKGYRDYSNISKERSNYEEVNDEPYIITEDEFGDVGYTEISLTLYADNVLVDEDDGIIEEDDIKSSIGIKNFKKYYECEDDSYYIRNDTCKCDYEILLDSREYSDFHMSNE